MGEYYKDIMKMVLARTDDLHSPDLPLRTPRATFDMRREFNDTSKFTAYSFIVDFTGLFGDFIKPISLKKGCVSLRLEFSKTTDYLGREFCELIENSEKYHALFKDYDIFRIMTVWLPSQQGRQTRLYHIGPTGRPL